MKRLFIFAICLILCAIFVQKVFALDDYVLHTDKPIVKLTTSDANIIVANVLVTIMNEKDTVIIMPKQQGKAVLTFYFKDETIAVPVSVKKNKTVFKKNPKLNFVKLDVPPQIFQIDLPPRVEEFK